MSFRRVRPRRSIRLTATPRVEAEIPAFVPEGSRDQLFRIVHTQRARKLRRRGVVLEQIEPGCYAWFETGVSFMQRSMARSFRKMLRARGPIPYTVEGFRSVRQATGRAMRQLIKAGGITEFYGMDVGKGDHGYVVTLTIPGEPPQVLRGFATDAPFEVEARRATVYVAGDLWHGLDDTPENRRRIGVQLMSAEELHSRYGKPKLSEDDHS